jgi:uncharacterized membrane protein YhaH (DUF805 family)
MSKPIDRANYGLISMVFLYSVIAAAGHSSSKPHWLLVANWITVPPSLLLGSLCTIGRLKDLGWSRWLTPAFALPWVLMIWAAWRQELLVLGFAALVMIGIQLLLILLPSPAGNENGPRT